jgi:flavin-dependent dehydrogenase
MKYDVLVAGAGPAGSTAAMEAARLGLSVLLLDKGTHPRFHVGESFLPRNLELIRELGLEDRLRAIPHTRKLGASLQFGDDETPTDFLFEDGLLDRESGSFNVARAPFDKMLFDVACERGVDARLGTPVESIDQLDAGGVIATTSDGRIDARVLVDATGQNGVVGRTLGTRRGVPGFEKVAYFGHLEGVPRRDGIQGGLPIIVMCADGWFWLIPIDETRTSVGSVVDASVAKQAGVPARRMLRWACGRCPAVWALVRDSDMTEPNRVQADFTYTCSPYAGPGYMLVGDSAVFIDPIFSTGVCLGMLSGQRAARLAPDVIAGGDRARRAIAEYHAYVDRASSLYIGLIRGFYKPAFRELFMRGTGPLGVHRAILTMLAGHVFPSPAVSIRWRWRFFEMMVSIQSRVAMVARRQAWSLLDAPPVNDEPASNRSPATEMSVVA